MNLILTKLSRQGNDQLGYEELGKLEIFTGDTKLFECVTLQRADILVDGVYPLTRYLSPKSGKMTLLVGATPGHSMIEIHIGNYLRDTTGCVLPGKSFLDMDGDGLMDVTYSMQTMAEILRIVTGPATLTVIKAYS